MSITLYEMLKQRLGFKHDQHDVFNFYNPLRLETGSVICLVPQEWMIGLEDVKFFVVQAIICRNRQFTSSPDVPLVDYELLAKRRGGEDVECRLRVIPDGGDSYIGLLLHLFDEVAFEADLYQAASQQNFQITLDGQVTAFNRCHGATEPFTCENLTYQGGKQLVLPKSVYFDFTRPLEHGDLEFLFIESVGASSIELWRGRMVQPHDLSAV